MKFQKLLTMTALIAVCAFFAVSQSSAHSPQHPGGGHQGPRPGDGPRDGGPGGPPDPGMVILRQLDLTDAQKAQIKAVHDAERPKVEPFHEQLRTIRCALDEAAAKGQFDEAKIRSLVAGETQARIELAVSQGRVQAAVYQVLTAEQRARYDKLQDEMRSRRCNPSPNE